MGGINDILLLPIMRYKTEHTEIVKNDVKYPTILLIDNNNTGYIIQIFKYSPNEPIQIIYAEWKREKY